MRHLPALLLVSLFLLVAFAVAGCPVDEESEWSIRNPTTSTRWLEGRLGEPDWQYQVDVDGDLVGLSTARDLPCMRTCGSTPRPNSCTPPAAEFAPSVLAVRPGDDLFESPGPLYTIASDFWGTCRDEIADGTTVQVTLCHGPAALDAEGELVPEPEFSGLIDEAQAVLDPTCETFEGVTAGSSDFLLGAADAPE